MGADSIPDEVDGDTIFADDVEVLKRVLTENFLPRGSDGVVADEAGSLGDSTRQWLAAFLKTLKLFGNGAFVTFKAPATLVADYDLEMPDGLPTTSQRLSIDPAGKISAQDIAMNKVISAASGNYLSGSSTYADVTNLSGAITTIGRPVFIGLIPDGASPANIFTATSVDAKIAILRDGVIISEHQFIDGGGNKPPGCIWFFDAAPSAAAHTYTVQAKTASGFVQVNNCRLLAYEL